MKTKNPSELDHKPKKVRLKKAASASAQNDQTGLDGLSRTRELINKIDLMINPNKG